MRVITFGTFDLFHYGHLRILQRAKELGDYLIVGVSSDELNEKKGKKSVFPFKERLEIVKSIKFVNEVFIEEELELKDEYIKKYRADILVMGDDWKGKFDWVSCKTIYFERTQGVSTSLIIDNIKTESEKSLCNTLDLLVYKHSEMYQYINKILEPLVLTYSDGKYLTPNCVTYFRTCLIIPTLMLIRKNFFLFSSLLIFLNDFLDFFDGVVARAHKKKNILYDEAYGSFVDAIADKIFNVTLWLYLIFFEDYSIFIVSILMLLCFIEMILGVKRTFSFRQGKILHADQFGKTKQTLETLGSGLLLLDYSKYIGFLFLITSVYFSIKSLLNKFK